MRISLSVIFGALFSFFLLVAMTRLVSTIDIPARAETRLAAADVIPAVRPTQPEIRHSKLPVSPTKVTMPKQLGPTIDVDDNGTTVIDLPPGTEGPGVIREWPGIGPIGPGKQEVETERRIVATGLQPLQQFPPLYPRELAARGVEGWVTLTFDVRQDGTVGNIQVRDAKPRGAFEDAARKAVQRWRYQPGLSSPAEQSVTLNFSLEN